MKTVNKADYRIHTHDYFDLNFYSIQHKETGQIVYGGEPSFTLEQCENMMEQWDGTLVNGLIV